jgi:hypothetical protein
MVRKFDQNRRFCICGDTASCEWSLPEQPSFGETLGRVLVPYVRRDTMMREMPRPWRKLVGRDGFRGGRRDVLLLGGFLHDGSPRELSEVGIVGRNDEIFMNRFGAVWPGEGRTRTLASRLPPSTPRHVLEIHSTFLPRSREHLCELARVKVAGLARWRGTRLERAHRPASRTPNSLVDGRRQSVPLDPRVDWLRPNLGIPARPLKRRQPTRPSFASDSAEN